jgi:amidase
MGHLPPCVGPFSILGAIGPMARTVADVDLLFRTVVGQHSHDPTGAPVKLRHVSVEEAKEIPIGWFEDDGLTPVTQETRQAVRDAADTLARRGFKVKAFRPTFLEEARRLWHVFFVQCGAMFYESSTVGRRDELSPTFCNFLEIAEAERALTAKSLLQSWAECDMVRSQLLAEMQEFPVLLMPVCAIPAFRHGERQWTVEGRELNYLDAMRFTQWFNLLASPAAVVPVGRSDEGLPIGVQIAGRPFDDEIVLAVATAVESEFGYRPPPLS